MAVARMWTFVVLASCTREVPQSTARPVPSEVAPTKSAKGIAWGTAVDNLRLGIELEGTTLVTHLQNVGKSPLVIMSHVATHERQSDWLTLTINDKGGERVIAFDDDRDKSAPVTAKLPPGEEAVDRWDLAAWSARSRNGKHAFDATFISLRATYRVIPAPTTIPPIGDKVWSGAIESGRL